MKKYVFGVDVGGTTVKMGLFNVAGEVLENGKSKLAQKTAGKRSFLISQQQPTEN